MIVRVCIGQEIFARLKDSLLFRFFFFFFLFLSFSIALNFYSARNWLSNGANSSYFFFSFFLFSVCQKLSDSVKFPAMKFNLPVLCRGTRFFFLLFPIDFALSIRRRFSRKIAKIIRNSFSYSVAILLDEIKNIFRVNSYISL